jgi:hypothetical protein
MPFEVPLKDKTARRGELLCSRSYAFAEAFLRDADAALAARRAEVECQYELLARINANRGDVSDARETLDRLEIEECHCREHRNRLAAALSS